MGAVDERLEVKPMDDLGLREYESEMIQAVEEAIQTTARSRRSISSACSTRFRGSPCARGLGYDFASFWREHLRVLHVWP